MGGLSKVSQAPSVPSTHAGFGTDSPKIQDLFFLATLSPLLPPPRPCNGLLVSAFLLLCGDCTPQMQVICIQRFFYHMQHKWPPCAIQKKEGAPGTPVIQNDTPLECFPEMGHQISMEGWIREQKWSCATGQAISTEYGKAPFSCAWEVWGTTW